MSVKPIPDEYHSVTPYIFVRGAAKAIEWYGTAFDAKEICRMPFPDGEKLMHAEIEIGDSRVMLTDENPDFGVTGPETLGGCSANFLIYVENVDEKFEQAIAAGAEEVRPVTDQFYGDRSGCLRDPFGHVWTLSTHVEDMTEEELEKRAEKIGKEMC
ncbi:MAG: VOC family protein [Verrucomicrobiales bacterium]|nr:VOC family protein [Verrucomicrobiales bacterium]